MGTFAWDVLLVKTGLCFMLLSLHLALVITVICIDHLHAPGPHSRPPALNHLLPRMEVVTGMARFVGQSWCNVHAFYQFACMPPKDCNVLYAVCLNAGPAAA